MSFSLDYILVCMLFPFIMAYAAASDLLTMRISNRVTSFLAASFAVYALSSNMSFQDMGWHVAAGVLTLIAAFAMFARGWVGGGDAKLAATTALWLGLSSLVDYLVVAAIIGGALTLAIVYLRTFPLPKITLRIPFVVKLHDSTSGIPYGIALATAALIVMPNALGWERLAYT
ncbi:A24 family peptidase [Methylorubrum suomiense]|nr:MULTISPECIES: prepilin peptidase [Methylobacteriaceae]